MSKFINFMVLMCGILLLCHISGVIQDTPNSVLINLLIEPENMRDSSIVVQLLAAIAIVGGVGAIILGFTNINVELFAAGAFAVWIFNIGWDFVAVFSAVASVNRPIAILIFSPFLIAYIISAFLFWRGRD